MTAIWLQAEPQPVETNLTQPVAQPELVPAMVPETPTVGPESNTERQYCIPAEDIMRCSISKRPCGQHDDCPAVIIA